ncbi:MAG: sulfotransferase family protein [Alphaproteobacteria bacterium]|nr:sulfotransferase family protein [Alphaproteobacteria bacterium]
MTDQFDWDTGALLDRSGPGRVLFTTRRYPIFYLQITKCGCTYVRNLLYYLDHDAMHPKAARIHAHDEDFVKADLIPREIIKGAPGLFAVIRDPVDRFLSLYFDKIANQQNQFDAGMRRRVSKAAGLDLEHDDLATHRENCLKTLAWFSRNLDTKNAGKPNPHWQRQSVRLARIEGLGARLLTLDGLSAQLAQTLGPVVPDFARKAAAVTTRNTSKKRFTKAEIMTPEIAETVRAIYEKDAALYQKISAEWAVTSTKEG